MQSNQKFRDPFITLKGEERAYVDLIELKTIWFNTGSVCNLTCQNCYIESSPRNNRLSFLTVNDVTRVLDESRGLGHSLDGLGFTGGEPFANPHMTLILEECLNRGYKVLVLTNAYKAIRKFAPQLLELQSKFGAMLNIRVSLDHFKREIHEAERGELTFDETLQNMKWLADNEFHLSIAGRSLHMEAQDSALKGYQDLLDQFEIRLKLTLGENIVIFPEMDHQHNVPEITTNCWSILKKSPESQMCASERMIVKERGKSELTVMPCTLLAYDDQFKLGHSLSESRTRVQLNHPFCAKFCVLGGASCSSTK